MRSIGLTGGTEVEIITAYTATNQPVDAVVAGPAWVVIGAFYMPMGGQVQLEAIGLVSLGTVALTLKLFDVTAADDVSGSLTAQISSLLDSRAVSGSFNVVGGRVYQIQAQAIGPLPEFAIVHSAQLI